MAIRTSPLRSGGCRTPQTSEAGRATAATTQRTEYWRGEINLPKDLKPTSRLAHFTIDVSQWSGLSVLMSNLG